MSKLIQLREGTASQVLAGVPALAEPWVDTDNHRVHIGDNVTAGGWPAAKLAEVVTNTRVGVADTGHTVLPTDRTIAYTSLSASRAVTLPAASAYPTGTRLLVIDEAGNCSASVTIALNRIGSDTINGQTSFAINTAYGFVALESDGTSKWTVVDRAPQNVAQAPNGASIQFGIVETLASALSGATVTVAAIVPANCIVLAVGARVTTTITGATSFSVGWNGPGGSSSTFGSGIARAAGTINPGLIDPAANPTPAADLTLTAAGSNFTAGAVRLSIHYMICPPSTS